MSASSSNPDHHKSRCQMVVSRPSRRRRLSRLGIPALLVGAVGITVVNGCAQVKVRKVPTPTQYVRWTDKMQHKADKMEGIRFYLPRPFVNVFESFPVRTDIYLANGVVSADGKYVLIKEVVSESGLARYMAGGKDRTEIPTAYITDERAYEASAKAQSGLLQRAVGEIAKAQLEEGAKVPVGVVGPPPIAANAPASLIGPAGEPQPPTGINKRAVTNDNMAFAYQPLRGNFDMVYLPDFEEQYVVSSQAGLGNAEFMLNLGQGWSLQGFNSLTDNSELNRRIFHLIDTAMRMAQAAATAALGIPALPDLPPPPGTTMIPRAQAGAEMEPQRAGTPVSLKFIVVHYAAKGLYPVIKPRELQERIIDQETDHCFLDLFKLFPKIKWASEHDPEAIRRAQLAVANEAGSYTVPRYPYQYLSFNTFRYMAIETIKPTEPGNPPFKYLYDKTGTTGEAGAARQGEIDALLKALKEISVRPAEEPERVELDGLTRPELERLCGYLRNKEIDVAGYKYKITRAVPRDEGNDEVKVTLAPPTVPPTTSAPAEGDVKTETIRVANDVAREAFPQRTFTKNPIKDAEIEISRSQ